MAYRGNKLYEAMDTFFNENLSKPDSEFVTESFEYGANNLEDEAFNHAYFLISDGEEDVKYIKAQLKAKYYGNGKIIRKVMAEVPEMIKDIRADAEAFARELNGEDLEEADPAISVDSDKDFTENRNWLEKVIGEVFGTPSPENEYVTNVEVTYNSEGALITVVLTDEPEDPEADYGRLEEYFVGKFQNNPEQWSAKNLDSMIADEDGFDIKITWAGIEPEEVLDGPDYDYPVNFFEEGEKLTEEDQVKYVLGFMNQGEMSYYVGNTSLAFKINDHAWNARQYDTVEEAKRYLEILRRDSETEGWDVYELCGREATKLQECGLNEDDSEDATISTLTDRLVYNDLTIGDKDPETGEAISFESEVDGIVALIKASPQFEEGDVEGAVDTWIEETKTNCPGYLIDATEYLINESSIEEKIAPIIDDAFGDGVSNSLKKTTNGYGVTLPSIAGQGVNDIEDAMNSLGFEVFKTSRDISGGNRVLFTVKDQLEESDENNFGDIEILQDLVYGTEAEVVVQDFVHSAASDELINLLLGKGLLGGTASEDDIIGFIATSEEVEALRDQCCEKLDESNSISDSEIVEEIQSAIDNIRTGMDTIERKNKHFIELCAPFEAAANNLERILKFIGSEGLTEATNKPNSSIGEAVRVLRDIYQTTTDKEIKSKLEQAMDILSNTLQSYLVDSSQEDELEYVKDVIVHYPPDDMYMSMFKKSDGTILYKYNDRYYTTDDSESSLRFRDMREVNIEKLTEQVVPASQLGFKHQQLAKIQEDIALISELKAEDPSNELYTNLLGCYDKAIEVIKDAIDEDPIGTVLGNGDMAIDINDEGSEDPGLEVDPNLESPEEPIEDTEEEI